jgi:alpha-L-fucosidase
LNPLFSRIICLVICTLVSIPAYAQQRRPNAGNAVDDDVFTRWTADAGTKQAWLEVDLGQPTTFNRARITEELDRVQEFELQYKAGNEWTTFAQGTSIGSAYSSVFEPVTARYVRLNILKATEGPTIWEFQLFAPKK